MKNLWANLLNEEYIHPDTYRMLQEEQPHLISSFVIWTNINRATLRKMHLAGVVPTEWWEMFLTKQPSDTFKFQSSVFNAYTKMLPEEDVQCFIGLLNEEIKQGWR